MKTEKKKGKQKSTFEASRNMSLVCTFTQAILIVVVLSTLSFLSLRSQLLVPFTHSQILRVGKISFCASFSIEKIDELVICEFIMIGSTLDSTG